MGLTRLGLKIKTSHPQQSLYSRSASEFSVSYFDLNTLDFFLRVPLVYRLSHFKFWALANRLARQTTDQRY